MTMFILGFGCAFFLFAAIVGSQIDSFDWTDVFMLGASSLFFALIARPVYLVERQDAARGEGK